MECAYNDGFDMQLIWVFVVRFRILGSLHFFQQQSPCSVFLLSVHVRSYVGLSGPP